MENTPTESPSSNGPVKTIRDGRLKVNIWRVDGEKGPFPSLEYAKTITGKDGKPRDVHNFSESDNLRIEKLCGEAHMEVRHIKREWAQEKSQSQAQEREDFKQSRRSTNEINNQPVQSQQR